MLLFCVMSDLHNSNYFMCIFCSTWRERKGCHSQWGKRNVEMKIKWNNNTRFRGVICTCLFILPMKIYNVSTPQIILPLLPMPFTFTPHQNNNKALGVIVISFKFKSNVCWLVTPTPPNIYSGRAIEWKWLQRGKWEMGMCRVCKIIPDAARERMAIILHE